VTDSELPCARSREPWDTRTCAPVLPFVFDLKLIREVFDLQGTDSGLRAHPERGYEPVGEANILPHAAFLSFVYWDFEAVMQHGRYVTTRDSRGSLRCSERLAEPSHTAIPQRMCYCTAKVAGPEAIMTMIPNRRDAAQ
jgi:hypothetical protein